MLSKSSMNISVRIYNTYECVGYLIHCNIRPLYAHDRQVMFPINIIEYFIQVTTELYKTIKSKNQGNLEIKKN